MKSTFGYLIVAFAALTFVPGGFGAHAKPVPRPGDVEQGDPWQQGGVFVLGPDGRELYRHISREAGDHPFSAQFLAALPQAA